MRFLLNNQKNGKMIQNWGSDHECQHERGFFEKNVRKRQILGKKYALTS